ncbi:MAG: class II aldolase/adducin family protein [Ignavibacteriae bacterium]|nr:MAG: class II aldolase/adducin family protein [Ignavibacteriota bacterium]
MSLKSDIVRFSKLCYKNRFLAATDGNLSIRKAKDKFLTTPSNLCKGKLTEKDIITVNSRGDKIHGIGIPSSEFKLHKYIYEKRDDVNAVIHTHPVFTTAFAAAGIALDKVVFPEIFIKLGKIPLAVYATPSTDEMPESISGYVKEHNAIMLANHGLVAFAATIEEAYYITEKVERIAEVSFYSRLLGGEKELNELQINKLKNLLKN